MKIENIPILKIHALAEEKYEREHQAGNTQPNEIYLTPAPKIDSVPTENSKNLITSGGVFEALKSADGGNSVQPDMAQTDSTQPDYIKNKIGDISLSNITTIYDMSDNGDNTFQLVDNLWGSQFTNRTLSYPERMIFKIKNKETEEETLIGTNDMEYVDIGTDRGCIVSVNTTTSILEVMNGSVNIPLIDESIPFAICAAFSIDSDINMFIVYGISSSNYEIIINYEGETINGLPDNILSKEFENKNGKLSLALGNTITRSVEENSGYGTILGSPNTSPSETMPFHVWDGVFNFVKNVQEGTPITVSFKNNGAEEEIGSCNLITNSVFDAAFGFDPTYTIGYWGLVNGNITMDEILTNPISWAPLDTNKPTFVVILIKYLKSGNVYVTFSSPYNKSYEGYEISISLTTTEQYSEIIQLSNKAIPVDTVPTEGSENFVSSGGIYTAIANATPNLQYDSTPTQYSTNLVKSGDIYTAIANATPNLQYDSTPTQYSTNLVKSGDIYNFVINTILGGSW